MIIEAGLTRYEAVNKEIEKQLEKQNKVTCLLYTSPSPRD